MSIPPTLQRIAKLRTLTLEFTQCDIGRLGVAELLGCSASAARYYLDELLDAGLVSLRPARPMADCVDRKLYRLVADTATVDAFLQRIAEPACKCGTRPGDGFKQALRPWGAADFSRTADAAPTRRDPLVAALFGAPGAARF